MDYRARHTLPHALSQALSTTTHTSAQRRWSASKHARARAPIRVPAAHQWVPHGLERAYAYNVDGTGCAGPPVATATRRRTSHGLFACVYVYMYTRARRTPPALSTPHRPRTAAAAADPSRRRRRGLYVYTGVVTAAAAVLLGSRGDDAPARQTARPFRRLVVGVDKVSHTGCAI